MEDDDITKKRGGDVEGYIPPDDPRRDKNLSAWHRDSHPLTKNKDGSPRVFYHGTAADFNSFDNKKTGSNDLGLWGKGHYSSTSIENANSYALRQGDGANVMPIHVLMKNPLILKTGKDLITRLPDGTNTKDLIGQNLNGSKIKDIAKANNHDGVIQLKPDGSVGDLVAYDSHQIKSATGNQGTFNPSEPDITKADGGALTDDEGITAYHGSPHDFERFDMSKIGTGEGAQAFGHGLYFAENPSVAKSYRPVSSENKPVPIIIDGQKFENPTAMQKLVAQHKGNVDAVHKAMSPHWERAASEFQSAPQDPDDLEYMLAEADHQQALAQKAELEALRGKKIEHDYSGHHEGHALAGHSYEVQINSHPDHFLDWDMPLNQQTGRVKRFLDLSSKLDGKPIENITGEQWLKNLGVKFLEEGAKNPSAAISEYLNRQGISGIKYLDQGSRTSEHKGTRNYVVFDDKLINVKRKYAQGGDVGTTRYHFADGGTPTDIDPITGKPIVKKPEAGDTSSTGGGGGTGPSVGGATPAPTPSSEGVAVSTTPTSAAPSSSPTPSPGISISAPDQASLSPEMAAMLAAAQAAEPAPPAAVENAAPAAPTAPEATAAPSAPAAPAAPTASPNAVAAANDPLEGLDQAGLTPEPAAPATALSPNAMLAHAMMAEQEANPALSQAAMMDVSGIASAENASMPGEGVGPGVFGESDVSSSNSDTMMGTSDTSAAANAAAAAAADSSDNGDGGDSGGGSGGEGGGQGGDSGGGSGGSDGGGEGGGSGGDGGGGGGDGGGGGGEKRGGFIKFKGRKNKGAIDKALKVVHRKNGGKVTYNLKPDNDDRKHAGYKDDGGKMTWMSPDKFLAQTQKMQMDKEDKKSIKRFEKKIKKGKGLNPLAIYPSGGQDGRHRATAAKHEGITKVPVITWPKKASGGSIVDRALMVTSKKAKASGDAR